MTKKTGSFVYVLGRNCKLAVRGHHRTLNQAKEYGLEYIYKKDEPFYRFTKIPFPYLFYVSDNYIVFANYATTDSEKIPYSVNLNEEEVDVKNAMKAFEEKFDKEFYYDRESRTKSRDVTKRTQKKNTNRRKEFNNKEAHFNTSPD